MFKGLVQKEWLAGISTLFPMFLLNWQVGILIFMHRSLLIVNAAFLY
ncbi:hypothetical protein [Bacillus sp. mrc49]|nr:hypothetical protein [Bacillus sp. mrc49]